MEFIDELKKNNICKSIINSVDVEDKEVHTFNFTIGESIALQNVAFHVFNSFCNNSDENDGLSNEMNHFLDNLASARDKLDNY